MFERPFPSDDISASAEERALCEALRVFDGAFSQRMPLVTDVVLRIKKLRTSGLNIGFNGYDVDRLQSDAEDLVKRVNWLFSPKMGFWLDHLDSDKNRTIIEDVRSTAEKFIVSVTEGQVQYERVMSASQVPSKKPVGPV